MEHVSFVAGRGSSSSSPLQSLQQNPIFRDVVTVGDSTVLSDSSKSDKKILPGRRQQRHSTEIGMEYHRWWAVRNAVGFETNEHIAGLLLDGFHALLEQIVLMCGGDTYQPDPDGNPPESSINDPKPPDGEGEESSEYRNAVGFYCDTLWRMCGQQDSRLQELDKASQPLQDFIIRLMGYLKIAKGRSCSLNYKKKRFKQSTPTICGLQQRELFPRPIEPFQTMPLYTPPSFPPPPGFGLPFPISSLPGPSPSQGFVSDGINEHKQQQLQQQQHQQHHQQQQALTKEQGWLQGRLAYLLKSGQYAFAQVPLLPSQQTYERRDGLDTTYDMDNSANKSIDFKKEFEIQNANENKRQTFRFDGVQNVTDLPKPSSSMNTESTFQQRTSFFLPTEQMKNDFNLINTTQWNDTVPKPNINNQFSISNNDQTHGKNPGGMHTQNSAQFSFSQTDFSKTTENRIGLPNQRKVSENHGSVKTILDKAPAYTQYSNFMDGMIAPNETLNKITTLPMSNMFAIKPDKLPSKLFFETNKNATFSQQQNAKPPLIQDSRGLKQPPSLSSMQPTSNFYQIPITDISANKQMPLHNLPAHPSIQSKNTQENSNVGHPTRQTAAVPPLMFVRPRMAPADTSLAPLSSLVDNVVYNSQGAAVLRPMGPAGAAPQGQGVTSFGQSLMYPMVPSQTSGTQGTRVSSLFQMPIFAPQPPQSVSKKLNQLSQLKSPTERDSVQPVNYFGSLPYGPSVDHSKVELTQNGQKGISYPYVRPKTKEEIMAQKTPPQTVSNRIGHCEGLSGKKLEFNLQSVSPENSSQQHKHSAPTHLSQGEGKETFSSYVASYHPAGSKVQIKTAVQEKSQEIPPKPSKELNMQEVQEKGSSSLKGRTKGSQAKAKGGYNRSLVCSVCELVFESKVELLVHRYELHSHVCGECDGRFLSRSGLDVHKASDHPELRVCPHCRFNTVVAHDMEEHLRNVHTDKSRESKHSDEINCKSDLSKDTSDKLNDDVVLHKDPNLNSTCQKAISSLEKNCQTLYSSFDSEVEVCENKGPMKSSSFCPCPELSSLDRSKDLQLGLDPSSSMDDHAPLPQPCPGAVFPSFSRQSGGQGVSDSVSVMYSQVLEHCQLSGPDALDMQVSSRGQGSSEEWSESDDPPQLVIDMAGEAMEGQTEEGMLEGEGGEWKEDLPLCLVTHKRHLISVGKTATDKGKPSVSRKTSRHPRSRTLHKKSRVFKTSSSTLLSNTSLADGLLKETDQATKEKLVMRISLKRPKPAPTGDKKKVKKKKQKREKGKENDLNGAKQFACPAKENECEQMDEMTGCFNFKVRCRTNGADEDDTSEKVDDNDKSQTPSTPELKLDVQNDNNATNRNTSLHERHKMSSLPPKKRSIRKSPKKAQDYSKPVSLISTTEKGAAISKKEGKTESKVKTPPSQSPSHDVSSTSSVSPSGDTPPGISQPSKKRPKLHCQVLGCDSTFSRVGSLDLHLLKNHRGAAVIPCSEILCSLKFSSHKEMRLHVTTEHSKPRKFMCSWAGCSRRFHAQTHLRVHLMTHTGEKPIACRMCDYRCRQRTALLWHTRRHHGINTLSMSAGAMIMPGLDLGQASSP